MSRAENSPVGSQEKKVVATTTRGKRFGDAKRGPLDLRSSPMRASASESRESQSRASQVCDLQIALPPPTKRQPTKLSVGKLAASKSPPSRRQNRPRSAENIAGLNHPPARTIARSDFASDPAPESARRFRPSRASINSAVAAKPVLDEASTAFRFGPIQVERGRAGDHSDVFQLLLAVCHGPSRDEFHAAQEDPAYEPSNRLLIKRSGRIVSHLQVIPRTMLFGHLRLPVEQLAWLATLPEFRSQGCAGQLLAAANRAMAVDGTLVGMLRTRIPHFFHHWGWAVCGRHSRSRAKARQILARYWADPELRRQPLNIRLWRHVELPALMRIYDQNTASACGPLERTEAYWRWLIGRKAFDHIFVALAGPDKLELNEATAPIVGYAVIRQNRVVELLTDPAHPTAGAQLLARACADAIERDQQDVALEAPPQSPLHRFVAAAEGDFHHHEADDQEVFMMRLMDTAALIRCMAPQFADRLQVSDVSRRCELGFHVGDQKYLLTVGRHGVQFAAGRLGRNYVACNRAEMTRLILGHSDPAEAAAQNRLMPSTQVALQLTSALFPRLPLWRPPWDDLSV